MSSKTDELNIKLINQSDNLNHKNFKCFIEGCNKVYSKKYRLIIHLRSHEGVKPYKCNHCLKSFLEKANLKVHLRTHTNERPYICDFEVCNAAFKTCGQLKDHKIQHTQIRTNICHKCDKTFTRKSTLKSHMLIHEDSYPFKCEFNECQRFFREKSNMKKHLKKHLGSGKIYQQKNNIYDILNNHDERDNNYNDKKILKKISDNLNTSDTCLNINHTPQNDSLFSRYYSDINKNDEEFDLKIDGSLIYFNKSKEINSSLNDL